MRKIVLLCLSAVFLLWLISPRPELLPWQTWSSAYYDQQGKLLRLTVAADDRYRLWSPIEDISPEIQQATLLYEDQYFYQHVGINVVALWRAFVATYISGERRIGASTITMQVARHAFVLNSKTLWGKTQQILAALWIERHYSKAMILQAYLNTVSYGGNIEGITAASLIYFHKTPAQLNLAEAMALAVIPQNPVKRNPNSQSGYESLMRAREILITRWRNNQTDEGTFSQEWLSLPLKMHSSAELPFEAPHFVQYVSQRRLLQHGRVNTSLLLSQQKRLEGWIKKWVSSRQHLGIQNAGALLVNNHSQAIEAWVGSADFFDDKILGQVDIVTALRSPGSTLKPFVYGLAMDQGLIHPLSMLKDIPKRFAGYTPENYDRKFTGPINATDALITSRNVPAVKLAAQLSHPDFYQWLGSANINIDKHRGHYGLSLVLGGLEVSMLDLARLYVMLNNEGALTELIFKDVALNKKQSPEKSLLSPESAWLTLSMLRQNPPPGQIKNPGLIAKKNNIAWKTGTSFAFRDAWAVGSNKDYTLVVWVGNFDGSGNSNFVGRSAAGPLFFNIMRDIESHNISNEGYSFDSTGLNLTRVKICKATGALPGKYCPQLTDGWFIPGVSPIKTANVYRPIPLNKQTGQRECYHVPGKTRLQVFEFWPSDIVSLYEMAGIQRRVPPSIPPECKHTGSASYLGGAPIITSPIPAVEYQVRLSHEQQKNIVLQASLDADAKLAYWFINNDFIGQSKASEPLFWPGEAGDHLVTVVDDRGLSDSVNIAVRLLQ